MNRLSTKRLDLLLVLLGVALWTTLAFFAFVFPQTPARRDRITAALGSELPLWAWIRGLPLPAPEQAITVAVAVALFGGLAFAFYSAAIYATWRRPAEKRTVRLVLGVTIGLFATSIFALPNFNTDIYNYIAQGRITAVHDANPHYVAADDYPDDPIYPYASGQYTAIPNDYLPAWTILNAGLAASAGDEPVRALLWYRSAFFLMSTANLLLIVGILSKLAPSHLLSGTIAYGWHPVVVLEGQSRVDTAMAFFLLLSLFFLFHRHRLGALVALTLSVFTKWITLPLLGMYFLRDVFTGRWGRLARDTAICLATVVVIYLPFVEDVEIFRMHVTRLVEGGSTVPEALQTWVLVGFAVLVVALSWRTKGNLRDMVRSWAVVMLVFVAFLSEIGFAWYVIVPAALVALVQDWRVVVAAIALGLAALAFQLRDAAFTTTFPLPELFEIDRFWVFLLMSIAGGGLGGAVMWTRRRASRGSSPY